MVASAGRAIDAGDGKPRLGTLRLEREWVGRRAWGIIKREEDFAGTGVDDRDGGRDKGVKDIKLRVWLSLEGAPEVAQSQLGGVYRK